MQSNLVNRVLSIMLGVCLLASVVLCLQFIFVTRDTRSLNGQMSYINGFRATLQSLVADCLAYSDHNPAINPILESANLKAKSASGKPAAK